MNVYLADWAVVDSDGNAADGYRCVADRHFIRGRKAGESHALAGLAQNNWDIARRVRTGGLGGATASFRRAGAICMRFGRIRGAECTTDSDVCDAQEDCDDL